MKILAIVSGLDFRNHTRRSTLAAIHKLNPEMDVLLFNSIRNYFRVKNTEPGIRFFYFHFWVIEKLRRFKFLTTLEQYLRGRKYTSFFKEYDYIFCIDPNQVYLFPYINEQQKIIYLLRDPVILQHPSNYQIELSMIRRANIILAVSENLQTSYIKKHYGFLPGKILLWSNAVDLELWDYGKYHSAGELTGSIAGMAGNINQRTDLQLLKFLLNSFPELQFQIAGKINLGPAGMKLWKELLGFRNLKHIGYIPFVELPAVITRWDIGLLLESKEDEYSSYFNHNKIYQYLAMGKPFVSFDYNKNFNQFKNVAFIAKDHVEYAEMIPKALSKSGLPETVSECLSVAMENSTEKRAAQFMTIIRSL
jgi:hypothetical protein